MFTKLKNKFKKSPRNRNENQQEENDVNMMEVMRENLQEQWKQGVIFKHIILEIEFNGELITIEIGRTKEIKKTTILFNKNEIQIGSDDGILNNTIGQDTTHQEIVYQNQSYQLTKEELMAIYIMQFIRITEKEYVIDSINLIIKETEETTTEEEKKTMIKSIQLIWTKSIQINRVEQQLEELPEEEFQQVIEILEKQNEYLKFKRQIERMQQIMKETNDTSHPELLNLNINEEYTSTKLTEIKKQLTCSEKTKYKLCELDNNYCLFLASQYFNTIEDFMNLELSTTRAINNMSKFHYNPIPLTEQTRPFFDHLQTLNIYTSIDNRFLQDQTIRQRKEIKDPLFGLFRNQIQQLESWIGAKCTELVFDSTKDSWAIKSSVLNERISRRSRQVFVVEDDEGNVFGYYLRTLVEPIPDDNWYWSETDSNSFLFSLYSNGRINGMMKFEIKDKSYGLGTYDSINGVLISLGGKTAIGLMKEHKKQFCWCSQEDGYFNYHGIENVLCGRSGRTNYFTMKRLIVIQMR